MRIRHPAWLLQAVLLWALAPALGACRDKPQPKKHQRAPSPGAKSQRSRGDSPLGRLLRQVPADARWAVVSADLHSLRRVLSHTAALLSHHKQLAPVLHRWRTRTERIWGSWPLDKGSWDRLGLRRPSGGALYRRADGTTVVLFHSGGLAQTLEAIHQAIRRRGGRKITAVKPLRVAGKPAFRLDGWTCATRGQLSACADVAPDRFEAAIRAPRRSLWETPLGQVPGRYLQERLGVWIRASHPGAATLQRGLASLLSTGAKGFWFGLSLHRRLQMHAVVVTAPGPKPRTSSLPQPGHSGLAAARGAPLVIRLRMGPRRLAEQAQRLWPALKPAVDLLRGQAGRGEGLVEEMLNGEVVLLSEHAGVAGILGLRSRARGLRAMKKLMLRLAPHITRWQKHVRARGRGWDLSLTRSNLGDTTTHRLTLRVPPKAGPGAPTLRDGRMTLLWGVTQGHLVVATDANLFRRLLAQVEQPDRSFLKALGDGAGRRGFREHRAVAVLLRPDDPLYALPPGQRAAARRWLEGFAPSARAWATWIRTLVDLTNSATMSCEPLRAGIGCHLGITLLTEPGPQTTPKAPKAPKASTTPLPHLTLDVRYREALIKKWGGNREGYLTLIRALATTPAQSPLRAKASRVLAHRRGVASAGLEGLWLSAWLPWSRHRHATAARQEAPRELGRLTRALQRLASRARSLPPRQRKRWFRGFRSTKITPIRSCCAGGVRRCQSSAADWRHPTWRRLAFSLGASHRYRYQILWEPGAMRHRVVLRALGDYNCNGRSSLLQRVGSIDTATGTLSVGPVTRVRADD